MKDKVGAAIEIMQVLENHNATADEAKSLFECMQIIQDRVLESTTIETKKYVEEINYILGD